MPSLALRLQATQRLGLPLGLLPLPACRMYLCLVLALLEATQQTPQELVHSHTKSQCLELLQPAAHLTLQAAEAVAAEVLQLGMIPLLAALRF